MRNLGTDELAHIIDIYIASAISFKKIDLNLTYCQLLVLSGYHVRNANDHMIYLYFKRNLIWHRKVQRPGSTRWYDWSQYCYSHQHSKSYHYKWYYSEDLHLMQSWSVVECQRFHYNNHYRMSALFKNSTVSCLIGFIIHNEINDRLFFVNVENIHSYTFGNKCQEYTICPIFKRKNKLRLLQRLTEQCINSVSFKSK